MPEELVLAPSRVSDRWWQKKSNFAAFSRQICKQNSQFWETFVGILKQILLKIIVKKG